MKKRQISGLTFNWFFSNETGEEFGSRHIGQEAYRLGSQQEKITCTSIVEHEPMGPGDRFYYDVYMSNGDSERIFNPNQVFYKEVE